VTVPYVIEYVRRGCSKVESGIFWEDRAIVIQSAPDGPPSVRAFLELADEDLVAARKLLDVSTRSARYHVQQWPKRQ
jgi:hypothetical protein